jgi:peptide-methionine (R)-S-oxide reductase
MSRNLNKEKTMSTVNKTDQEWRQALTADEFRILRQKGTEPAFSGVYFDTKTEGVYLCKGCNAELFRSDDKFDSGCGWPSFTRPLGDANVDEHRDVSHGMVRTEVTYHHCGSHLGHVFNDGPRQTGGLRYCINSACLNLDEKSLEEK